jgi:hypothetical protein
MGAVAFIAFYGIKIAISQTDEDTLDALDGTRSNMACTCTGAA